MLGSGTGNDVAAAVRNGAGDVTGVEIDPVILQEGRKLHFEQPYSSPHVHAILNDARSYLQNSNHRFDVIVFAFLDSHTTSSYYSTIRIDNYVYTLEALRRAKTLLKPDGIMVIKFAVLNPWIAGRLYELAQTVFGNPAVTVPGTPPDDRRLATADRAGIEGSEACCVRDHQRQRAIAIR